MLMLIRNKQKIQVEAINVVVFAFFADAFAIGQGWEFRSIVICIESRRMKKCNQPLS